ncbi:MAG: S49 family peptidase, partial [Tepidisphaeraceae bacterium]
MTRKIVRSIACFAMGMALLVGPATVARAGEAGKPTVPVFDLRGDITESPGDETLALFGPQPSSLKDLVERMQKAADDANVKAVVIVSESASVGFGQIEELRQAMAKLRSAGKDVYVHADSLSTGQYALFCGATRLSLVPTGDLWLTGLYGVAPSVRGMLDKIGVQPDFLHCGDYKSASEIFMRDGPSPEADAMQNWLLDSLYSTLTDEVASGRGISADQVRSLIDSGPYTADKAKKAGLIDAVEHRQDFTTMLQGKYGEDVTFDRKFGERRQPQLDLSSPFAIFKIWGEMLGAGKKESDKDAIAIVYVDGAIELGEGEP